MVTEEMPDAKITDNDCFYKIEREGLLSFDMAELADRLGRDYTVHDFLVNIYANYGRIVVSDAAVELHARTSCPSGSATSQGGRSMAPKLEAVHAKGKRYEMGFDYARPDPKFLDPVHHPAEREGPVPDHDARLRRNGDREGQPGLRRAGRSTCGTANANVAEPRFMEAMKFAVPAFTDAEYQAVTGAGFLVASVKNQEMRQGFRGADAG